MGFMERAVKKKLGSVKKVRQIGVHVAMISNSYDLDLDEVESAKLRDKVVNAIKEGKRTVEFGERVLVVNKIVSVRLYDFEEEENDYY